MTRIAILTPTVTAGDAVGNDALMMRHILAERGHEARVFAEGWTLTELEIQPLAEIDGFLERENDLLIYHHSVGWDSGFEALRRARCRVAIKYHNVTPPEFFAGVSAAFENRARSGRQQLKDIALAGYDLYLADSAYNMQELLSEGGDVSRSFIVPPFHHIDRLYSLEPDFDVLDAYRDGATNILTVGRVSPNKGHVALIEAFAGYRYHYNSHSRLLIVGSEEESFQTYSDYLREVIELLWLQESVVLTGGVSDAALKSYYALSHAFMTASEHEGFCVPLVEAMAMKVPVVAFGSSAIPNTIGEAGLVWKERDSALLAESINALISDEAAAMTLAHKGRRRYEEFFTNERIATQFLSALSKTL